MQFIDKNNSTNKSTADAVVDNFITNQRALGKEPIYFLFGNTRYKNQLRDLLIEEQSYLCCYCMRELLKDETTTMEHVIPKGFNQSELNLYISKYPSYFTEVVHRDCFTNSSTTPPYPHQVAYQNIVASCKGILDEMSESSYCCNNKRRRGEIHPIMFNDSVEQYVEYIALSGEIRSCNTADKSSIDSTISNLGLNNDTLKEIRYLWALTAKKETLIQPSTNKRDAIQSLFGTDLFSAIPIAYKKYFKTEYYWKLLHSYRWFEGYFQRKWAAVT